MMRPFALATLMISSSFSLGLAQNKADGVGLFQTFFEDAPIVSSPNVEGFFFYGDADNRSAINLTAQAAFPVAPKIQVGGALGFTSVSFNGGGDESGLTDLAVSGRLNVMPGPTAISVGSSITLPIGSEDIDEGHFNFSLFGSLRHNLPTGMALSGTVGLEFIEVGGARGTRSQRESGLLLAGGVIYPMPSGLSIVSELNIRTEGEFILLTGGLDYALKGPGRIRGGIGIGLDDGAPDFAIRFGYLMGF